MGVPFFFLLRPPSLIRLWNKPSDYGVAVRVSSWDTREKNDGSWRLLECSFLVGIAPKEQGGGGGGLLQGTEFSQAQGSGSQGARAPMIQADEIDANGD